MLKLIPVNIRMFNEEGETDLESTDYVQDGEFDLEKFQQDFEASYSDSEENTETETEEETEVEETETETEETTETETETETEEEETETEEDQTETETEEDTKFDSQKQNQAFAQMRNQLQEEQKLSNFVRQLAEQQGVKPEELMQAYEDKKLEAEAEKQGVPVDMMKRINQLEQENQQTRYQQAAEKFNTEVTQVQEKHSLDDNQIQKVFDYMAQNNYVTEENQPLINFEDAYILANKDNLIDQAKDQGRQEYLKEKKRKQQKSTVDTGKSNSSSEQKSDPNDFSQKDIVDQFKKMGLDSPFE